MQRYAITSGETLDLTILLGETPGPAPLLRTPRQRKNVTLFLLKRRGRGHGQGRAKVPLARPSGWHLNCRSIQTCGFVKPSCPIRRYFCTVRSSSRCCSSR